MDPENIREQAPSIQRLAEFLDLVSTASNESEAIKLALDRAVLVFECDVAAIFRDGGCAGVTGAPAAVLDRERLAAIAADRRDSIEVPGIGICAAVSAEIDGTRDSLILARASGEFGVEELSLLRGMALTIGMGLRLLRSVEEERDLRHRSEQEARERQDAETRYRNLVERLPAIVYTAEPGEFGRWTYVSPQVKEILGFTPEEWMADASLWARQLHPEDRPRVLAHEDSMRDIKTPPPTDYRMLTRDGDVVWILDEAVQEVDDEGTPLWHGVLYDITKRKLAEEELERRAAQQASVARLGERALEGAELDKLMQMAVNLVAGTEGADHACIWELETQRRTLRLCAGFDVEIAASGAPPIAASRRSHAGAALESGLHVIVTDWESESRFEMPPQMRALGIRSSLSVVIEGHDRPFGVLDVHSIVPNRFGPQDVHFVQGAANVLADAIERKMADEALHHRVLHDSLTGLPNRLLFVDEAEKALVNAARKGKPVGVLFLDLDHFKLINDSLGHQTGDELLRVVAPRLRRHLRPGDVVARFGGDEFGILVADLADENEALLIGDRIRRAFDHPFLINQVEHFVTASVGIAVASPGTETPAPPVTAEGLVRDADAAMYRAKEHGRGRAELFGEELRARAVKRLEIERELRRGIDREELVLNYQPIVNLSSGEVVGMEALSRWQHPKRGVLAPGEFIPVAEESGLIDKIDRWVGKRACAQMLAWHQLRPDGRPFDISINLSARQVAHRDLVAGVREFLESSGLDPIHLHLEVTESVLVEEQGVVADALREIGELGVCLVLDDFGTGYSSLAYLNRFPFDCLKIDRRFVNGLGTEEESSAIVEAIIGMAKALGLDVVAEGVENETQLEELRRLGCPHAQGYYFSRPVAADLVTRKLTESGEFPVGPDDSSLKSPRRR